MRPVWAEVSLTNLRHNYRTIQDLVGPHTTICAVIKAHAYGHGAVDCAHALEAEGAAWVGVTSPEEGAVLREANIRARILLMSGFWKGEQYEVVRHNLTPAVWEPWHCELLDDAAKLSGRTNFPIHLKLDTGMARLGVKMEYLRALLNCIRESRNLKLEGVFSHLASAEVLDAPDAVAQERHFAEARAIVREAGLSPSYWHLANSAATISRPEARFEMVRPGLALFGYELPYLCRGSKVQPAGELGLRPALQWKTRIISIEDVPAGQAIGYNGTYVTPAPARVAALPIGYADGLNRMLSSKGRFILRDRYVPIIGRISMDLTMVDITDVPEAELGDEVMVIGESEHCRVSAWDHACAANTIPYEILCNISKRVARRYQR